MSISIPKILDGGAGPRPQESQGGPLSDGESKLQARVEYLFTQYAMMGRQQEGHISHIRLRRFVSDQP